MKQKIRISLAMKHLLEHTFACPLRTLNELVEPILKINLEKLKIKKVDAQKAPNPEMIHVMRVAIRRLRAALKTFDKIFPSKAKKIRADLEKLFRLLGKKRDLDVFSEFIFKAVNAQSISFPKLTRKIDQTRKQILTMLKSKFYASLIRSLEKLETISTKQNVLKVAQKRIRKALGRVLEIAPSIDSKVEDITLHKLRISLKKLRYICEFFEPICRKLGPFIANIKKIQDILGEHQDAIIGMSMLTHYKNQFSLDEFLKIQKNYELKKVKTCKSFFKIWKNFWVGVTSIKMDKGPK